MAITIALAGNPNSGKTTMFNKLTGGSLRTGNWPGVTVEKRDGRLKGNKDVIIQDLPGIYSLSPYTPEEVVARTYLLKESPDSIIDVVDATNIERNLYLTTQFLELEIPVVIALNMIDVSNKNGDVIDTKKLGETLGCDVVETSATKGTGTKEAAQVAIKLAKPNNASSNNKQIFSEDVEAAIEDISGLISHSENERSIRWLAIKLFERDEAVSKMLNLNADTLAKIDAITKGLESKYDDDSESIITSERYSYIAKVVKDCVVKKDKSGLTTSDKIDKIITNRILALPIFAVIMWLVYYISVSTVGAWGTDWVNEVLFGEIVPDAVDKFLETVNAAPWLAGLIQDGIVAGVGAVLGFLPQMLVLFICLAILEDCGYMSRIAFILDRIFRRFGLSGKSFIPMLVTTGCGVPGIMASRTIENENDRRLTVMTTTFVPCGAKLPIIALFAGAVFSESSWVAPSVYFLGIFSIIISGVMLKKLKLFSGNPAPFVMELPAYHAPLVLGVLKTMLDRGLSFVKRAGTIVLISAIVIWFLMTFNGRLEMVDVGDSLLAAIGNAIAPIFNPLGWGDWKATVATFTGLIAKENVVGTFGVLYGLEEVAEDGVEIWANVKNAFPPIAAYSFLAFNMLCAPCFAAIGAMRREMMSDKMTWFAVAYQCVFAYIIALIIYQIGMLTSGVFGVGTIFAIVFILAMIYMLFIMKPYDKRKPSTESLQEKAAGL